MSSGNSEHQVSECPGLHQVKYPATDDPRLTGQDWAGLLLQSEGLKARPTLVGLVAAPISRSDDDGAYKIFCYCVMWPSRPPGQLSRNRLKISSDQSWPDLPDHHEMALVCSARAFSGLW